MRSKDLGLPITYQKYPEYFDTPSDAFCTNEKNVAVTSHIKAQGAHTILDMTCGTGAQVLHLAQQGYTVVGSDFSAALVAQARAKAQRQKLDITFRDGDMRTLHVGTFDAVITIDNAIGHLVKADFEKTLQNIQSNLSAGGVYIFDILDLEAMTDEVIEADSTRMTNKRVTTDGTVIYNVRRATIDRTKGLLTSNNSFTIQTQAGKKKVKNRCSLQIYTKEELKQLLSKNGFEVIEQYNMDAYTFAPDEAGYSIMTVAKKVPFT